MTIPDPRPPIRSLLRATAVALAATATTLSGLQAQTARLGGFLSLDRRFEIGGDSVLVADFYNRLRTELSAEPGQDLHLFASVDLRFYDFAFGRSSSDLERGDRHFPTDLTVWEAYVELRRFLVDALDVTVGKQRVRWGAADDLNPTDLVNGHDLSDLVEFTARVPTWALRADYYLADETLTAVWAPAAHAPLMPRNGLALFRGALEGLTPPGPRTLTSLEDRMEAPSRSPEDGVFGLRLSGYAHGVDYSVSFVDGSQGVPVPKRVELRPVDTGADELTGVVIHELPRARFVGGDLVTEIRGVRVWGEATLVLPDPVETVTTLEGEGVLVRRTTLDDRAYVRSTLGLDYAFPGGWYANLQWAHGIFLEPGADALHDYLVGRVERSFLHDELELALGGALEVGSPSGPGSGPGYGFFPEVTYSPADNLESVVGLFLVGGADASLFGAWSETDQVYARVKVSF